MGLSLALRIAITVLLIAALLWWIGDVQASGAEKISSILARADPRFLVLVFCASTLDRVLMAFKWKRLLQSRDLDLGFFRALKIYCTALIWGVFLPSTVGADALRVGMTVRSGFPANDVIASVVVERMVGFLCSLVVSLLGLLLLHSLTDLEEPWSSLWWIGSLLLLVAIAIVALSLSRSVFDHIFGPLPARLRHSRLARRIQHLHGIYVDFCSNGRSIGLFALLTYVENLVAISVGWACALALHVDVSPLVVAGALPVSALAARLPVSLDGIGVFESVFAALLWMQGVPQHEAIAIALLGRVVQTAAWMPWWIGYFLETHELRPRTETTPRRRLAPR